MADFPDDLDRLAEWRRRRAEEVRDSSRDPGGGGAPREPEPPAEACER